MKIAVTFDDIPHKRTFMMGKYDFYTRQFEIPDDLAVLLTNLDLLYHTAQRALESLYETNGKYLASSDKEILECLKVVKAEPSKRPVKKSAAASNDEFSTT